MKEFLKYLRSRAHGDLLAQQNLVESKLDTVINEITILNNTLNGRKQMGKFSYPNAYIDTINACQLMCKTCDRGLRVIENSDDVLDINLFERILCKLKTEGTWCVGLYNWSEPFLNKNIRQYVRMVKKHGFFCELSTNLSLPWSDQMQYVLDEGIDNILVSTSGHTQEMYEINHVGGKLDLMMANLGRLAKYKHDNNINTTICLKFLSFHYNKISEEPLKNIAAELNIGFANQPASGDPLTAGSLPKEKEGYIYRSPLNFKRYKDGGGGGGEYGFLKHKLNQFFLREMLKSFWRTLI
jgi:organic radical activating enzyme